MKFLAFFGPEVKFKAGFCDLCVVIFSTEKPRTQLKSLVSLPFFCAIVLRIKAEHMQLIVA